MSERDKDNELVLHKSIQDALDAISKRQDEINNASLETIDDPSLLRGVVLEGGGEKEDREYYSVKSRIELISLSCTVHRQSLTDRCHVAHQIVPSPRRSRLNPVLNSSSFYFSLASVSGSGLPYAGINLLFGPSVIFL